MTKDEESALRIFETRVRQLILKYQELEKENQHLQHELVEKEQALSSVTAENERLKNDYSNLKIAKMIEISSDELNEARAKISKLIRDVDKCIALLNV